MLFSPNGSGALWTRLFAVLPWLAALPIHAENLLANPGFEELAADRPVRWDYFVQPKPGAAATLSDEAHGGQYAVWLHIPTPYEKDPVNNWSQNIIADLGGQTLRVSGYIRVEEAKEAALWVQSWRKRPWGVLGAESTSRDMPVYGTQDWQEVSMDVEVPEGVDFITLRCVLLGTGSAWFDDISVTRVDSVETAASRKDPAPEAATKDGVAKNEIAATETAAPPAPAVGAGAPDTTESGGVPEGKTPDAAAVAGDSVLPMVNQLESEVRRLRDANVLLTGTLEEIQSVNQELLKEMLAVQAELQELRLERAAAGAPALEAPRNRVPPLVPLSEAPEAMAP